MKSLRVTEFERTSCNKEFMMTIFKYSLGLVPKELDDSSVWLNECDATGDNSFD